MYIHEIDAFRYFYLSFVSILMWGEGDMMKPALTYYELFCDRNMFPSTNCMSTYKSHFSSCNFCV